MKRIKMFFKKADIVLLVSIPIILSLGLLAGSPIFLEKMIPESNPDTYFPIVGAISSVIAGLSGLAQIIRREAPGFMGLPIRGGFAVFTGVLWLSMCWGASIALIYLAFTS